jgi:hypothetical protein
MHSIIKDEHGRLVPLVRPKSWQATSVKLSRDRTDRVARARKQRKAWLATTQWMKTLDCRGIAELEATGISWSAVERWLDDMGSRGGFAARSLVKNVVETLSDPRATSRERFEARNELYRRLIAAGVVE